VKHLIDSIVKEHADVLARREAARSEFVQLDADARALTRLINEQGTSGVPGASLDYNQGWLRAAESTAAAFWKTLLPETAPQQIADAYTRWQARLEQLRTARSRDAA
jgi:hypothetical protein